MKKKIKAVFMALIICFTSFFSNIVSVSATVPGIVQAENIWLTLQTLAFTMGVNLPFISDKSISYNNDIQKQYIIDSIDKQYSDGVITQQQHDDALQQLDTMLLLPSQHGVGSAISIGQSLWNCLTRFFYDNEIKTDVDLYSDLPSNLKSVFDSWSGRCGIIYPVFNSNAANEPSHFYIVKSDSLLSAPVLNEVIGNGKAWYDFSSGMVSYSYMSSSNNALSDTRGWISVMSNSSYISYQFFENKAVDEVITSNNAENALVSYPTYQDYINGLNDVYSISDGQVVVTDTGEAPVVLDGDTLDNVVADINDGTLTWENSIPQLFANEDTGEIDQNTPVIGKKAIDQMIVGLNLDRLKTKFPFCIPNDLMLIMNGATAVSSNQAPVIEIPLKIEFNDHVYYDNDSAVVIDFNDFSGVVHIFREGFFLLFLIALMWVSIEILQSFFVVTE